MKTYPPCLQAVTTSCLSATNKLPRRYVAKSYGSHMVFTQGKLDAYRSHHPENPICQESGTASDHRLACWLYSVEKARIDGNVDESSVWLEPFATGSDHKGDYVHVTIPPPPKHAVTITHSSVEDNGWVKAGDYWSAMFDRTPAGVRGCPAGRSQVSPEQALADLRDRTNSESGTEFKLSDFVVTRRN